MPRSRCPSATNSFLTSSHWASGIVALGFGAVGAISIACFASFSAFELFLFVQIVFARAPRQFPGFHQHGMVGFGVRFNGQVRIDNGFGAVIFLLRGLGSPGVSPGLEFRVGEFGYKRVDLRNRRRGSCSAWMACSASNSAFDFGFCAIASAPTARKPANSLILVFIQALLSLFFFESFFQTLFGRFPDRIRRAIHGQRGFIETQGLVATVRLGLGQSSQI